MTTAPLDTLIQRFRHAALSRDSAGKTDGELLASYTDTKDEAAFAALVRVHGPMVLGVCRRVVRNHHDAEDAFQATFMVLARKATTVQPPAQVANWLHGVAYRIALKARTLAANRRARESLLCRRPAPNAELASRWHDLRPLLDEELARMPSKHRLPILLCDLEGKSIKAAAQQLGWPQGTLAGRLFRGRKLLAKRLAQRDVAFSAAALAAFLAEQASACVPSLLAASTIQAASGNFVSGPVAALVEGTLKAMTITKLKTIAAFALMLSLLALGGGLLTRSAANPPLVAGAPKPALPQEENPLDGEWVGSHDERDFVLIFGPGRSVRRIVENGPDTVGNYSVDWSKTPHELDLRWSPKFPALPAIVKLIHPGKMRIEIVASNQPRPKEFGDEAIDLLKQKKHAPKSEQANQQAERDLKIAEFYQRVRHFASAHFYYELVRHRYPETGHAARATQGLESLKQHRRRLPDGSEMWDAPQPPEPGEKAAPPPPVELQDLAEFRQRMKAIEQRIRSLEAKERESLPSPRELDELRANMKRLEKRLDALDVKRRKSPVDDGVAYAEKILIVGNSKTPAKVIRDALGITPGQRLDPAILRAAERRLAAFGATLKLVDFNEPGYKTVQVHVNE